MLSKSKLILLNIFILIFYSNNALANPKSTGFFTVDTEFCLVNSTGSPISISKVWDVTDSDWQDKTPNSLINQKVAGFSSGCWPLVMVRGLTNYNAFKIAINTDVGSIAWKVEQYDAVGEIYQKYNILSNNTTYYLMQKAGDNNGFATNVFMIEDDVTTQNQRLSNWMKAIPNHTLLKDIQLIGTHDAGVDAEDGVNCTIPSAMAIAQTYSLVNQMMHGVRYFDIRLEDGNNNAHYPYHKTWMVGCSSKKSFEQSLIEIINFIKSHDNETVFLKLSHTSSAIGGVMKMLDTYTSHANTGKYFYKSTFDTRNWANKSLGELRGKIVLLLDCEYSNYLNPEHNILIPT